MACLLKYEEFVSLCQQSKQALLDPLTMWTMPGIKTSHRRLDYISIHTLAQCHQYQTSEEAKLCPAVHKTLEIQTTILCCWGANRTSLTIAVMIFMLIVKRGTCNKCYNELWVT